MEPRTEDTSAPAELRAILQALNLSQHVGRRRPGELGAFFELDSVRGCNRPGDRSRWSCDLAEAKTTCPGLERAHLGWAGLSGDTPLLRPGRM